MCIELRDIHKSYGNHVVLDGVNAKLGNGVYGFLGANGVGKTTLFKIISGFLTNYQGKVMYPRGKNRKENLIGFLPQSFNGYPDMSVFQFLSYLANIKSDDKENEIWKEIEEKLEIFNLKDLKCKKMRELSGGQRRRVGLAQAFLLNPKIVLLDEPTTGLDPTERINFKNYIANFGHNQIVLISTHIVSDLEFIAKEILILKDGHFVMKGTEKELIHQCEGQVFEASFANELEMHKKLQGFTVSMTYESEGTTKARIISPIQPVLNAVKVKPTLNDVYLMNFEKEAHINAE